MAVVFAQTLKSSDGKRKVEIVKRENGTFGFRDLEFGVDEGLWFPGGKYSTGFFSSEEDALKEAKGRVGWLLREIDNSIK